MKAGDRVLRLPHRRREGGGRARRGRERGLSRPEGGQPEARGRGPRAARAAGAARDPRRDARRSPAFAESPLVRQGRLSVVPLTAAQWKAIESAGRAVSERVVVALDGGPARGRRAHRPRARRAAPGRLRERRARASSPSTAGRARVERDEERAARHQDARRAARGPARGARRPAPVRGAGAGGAARRGRPRRPTSPGWTRASLPLHRLQGLARGRRRGRPRPRSRR